MQWEVLVIECSVTSPEHGDQQVEEQDVGHHHVDREQSDHEAVLLRTTWIIRIVRTRSAVHTDIA